DYDGSGTVTDRSNFSGMTFGFSATHLMNKYVTHSAGVSRSVDTGFGSNFTDDFSIRYNINALLGPRLTSSGGFQVHFAEQSGSSGEDATVYRFTLGAGYQVLRRANLGLTYSHGMRAAERAAREYSENRVTLTASYQF
ncbi:MAG: outer membrane beta-barrel protein, partial [Verrucomicrobiales bacterium]|nr:outer membrane beta-barrel protein [Verrucomicrobiales bacterium]